MLVIYNPGLSPRAEYIFQFVFETCLKLPCQVVSKVPGAKDPAFLNYSAEALPNAAIHVKPYGLLSETGIKAVIPEVFEYNGHKVFFRTDGGDLPYDPFSLCFYMLSRYEEYLDFDPDRHGRFPATASVAYKHGFLMEPVADQAVSDLRELIADRLPDIDIAPAVARFQFSYDVDAPFAFRGKGLVKNALGGIASLLRGQYKMGWMRLRSTLSKTDDPFDIFSALLQDLERSGHKANFFLLLEHRGADNPMVDHRSPEYRALVAGLMKRHNVGIHPSYDCSGPEVLDRELSRFIALTGMPARISRNHFLRFRLPESFRELAEAGVLEDHSMAFPDHPGFRAGTSRPFPFYDLQNESTLPLQIHPFCLMDATFEYYWTSSGTTEIEAAITSLRTVVKQHGGVFYAVFHNDLMSDFAGRTDWMALHRRLLGDLTDETH